MYLRWMTLLACVALPVAAQEPTPRVKTKIKPDVGFKLDRDLAWDFDFDHKFDFDFDHRFDFDFDFPFKYESDWLPGKLEFELDADRMAQVAADAWTRVDVEDYRILADQARDVWKQNAKQLTDKFGERFIPGEWPRHGSWLHALPGQGTPEDSAYRAARDVLSRYEYRRASELMGSFVTRYPKSRHTPAAMYWRAFALYRVGTPQDLDLALKVLDEQRQQYPEAVEDPDVTGLTTRVLGALASRGNTAASTRLRQQSQQGVSSCDREDIEVRSEALSALVQSDPASAAPVLRRILARRDECSAPLRRRAVYLLGREGVGGTAEDLVGVAKNDPDPSVRSDALSRLAQMPGDGPVRQLEVLLTTGTDERTQRAALNALRNSDHPEAAAILRRAIAREDLPDQVRADAIRSLGRRKTVVYAVQGQHVSPRRADAVLSPEDMTMLRGLYEKTSSRVIRSAILETMASASGPAGDQWLASVVRNQNEDLRYRSAALGRLRRNDVAIEELSRLYDALSERELRSELIRILGARPEPAATDKLIEIAKSGTDPVIRRAAINALGRKDDPRTTKLLLELVEKQP